MTAPRAAIAAVAWLAACSLWPVAAAAAHTGGGGPTLSVGALAGPVRIDGVLDEEAWRSAPLADTLLTIEPHEGARPKGATRVRVLADPRTLVVGIECDDPDPAGIVSFTTARDANIDAEDHVRLVFDTFLDGRSGYVFAVNPAGARYDALVNPGGETENANWDGIWEAHTARSPGGWSVEIRIPVQTLGFARGLTTWHFNVQRRVQRLQETSRWAAARRDYRILQTSHAGLLTGLPVFDLGLGLSVRPSVVGGGGVPALDAHARAEAHASLDLTQRVGTNLLASFTANTDFAETDVDTLRTNLTRFALVFPEKRTFFLDGADIFEFGPGTGDDVKPYFSRRIGLVANGTVPIGGGAKLVGRAGRTSLGALAVRTRPGRDGAPGATLAAARVKQDVGEESSVGFVGTAGDPGAAAGTWTAGVDARYQTSKFMGSRNFTVGAWALAASVADAPGPAYAFGGNIAYPNDRWGVNLDVKRTAETFAPALGFVPRPGVAAYDLSVEFRPRPQNGWLRVMQSEFKPRIVTDLRSRWESYEVFVVPVNWRFESGDRFEFDYNPFGERLDAPFEIVKGVVIPPGSYSWWRRRVEVELASKRRVGGLVTWWSGGFYDGTLDQVVGTITINPTPLVTIDLSFDRNVAHLREGDFVEEVAGARAKLNLSPDLQLTAYVQYDNLTRAIGMNNRLRWMFSPVGDLFVIYNHNVRDLTDRWALDNNQLLVKLQYTIRR